MTFASKLIKMNVSVFSGIQNLTKELRIALPSVHFQEITADHDVNLKNAEIIIADYDLMVPHIYNLPKLKWLQGTWAGLDAIMPHITKPIPFLLTRFSGHHFGQMMTEYIIAFIINHERDISKINENQKNRDWNLDGKIHDHRVISDLTIGILGIGNVGSWIGKCLHMFGANVLGYGRRSTVDLTNEYNYMKEYFTKSTLSEFLAKSDYIINVLPTTPETTGLLNGNALQHCKEKQSVFINVGRGTIIDEKDLINALENKWLSAAILDVFKTEPLPKDSPLWGMTNVHITPHVSAVSKPKHIAEQFRENLKLYIDKKEIPTTVNFNTGY